MFIINCQILSSPQKMTFSFDSQLGVPDNLVGIQVIFWVRMKMNVFSVRVIISLNTHHRDWEKEGEE